MNKTRVYQGLLFGLAFVALVISIRERLWSDILLVGALMAYAWPSKANEAYLSSRLSVIVGQPGKVGGTVKMLHILGLSLFAGAMTLQLLGVIGR